MKIHHYALFAGLLHLPFAVQADQAQDYTAFDIQTNLGTITVQLNPTAAPVTVDNFRRYVDEHFYDNTLMHRVVDDFVIQGGGFDVSGIQKTTHAPIKLESANGLSNTRGTLAMARTTVADSATSQFYINTVDNGFLDYQSSSNPGYAVFGEVLEGLDVVDSIAGVSTQNSVPVAPVIIEAVRARAGTLTFNGLQPSYRTGDTLTVSVLENGAPVREQVVDMWAAIGLANGALLYLTADPLAPFSLEPQPYRQNLNPDETAQTVLSLTLPEGLAGDYVFYAVLNESGRDLSDINHSLRSNIAAYTIQVVD